jgi:hypothetical protein
MNEDPLVLTVNLKDYRLSVHQILMQAEEFFGKPLTNGEDGLTIEIGFEQPGLKEQLVIALAAFKR